jgi:hypothetical protein
MKIAILGTASSWIKGPFKDTEWSIWGVSGCFPEAPRMDRIYEIHKRKEYDKLIGDKPGYMEYCGNLKDNYVLAAEDERFPDARIYPKADMVAKHGPHPFTSSVAWMLAEAIALQPEAIGFWGVNMCSDSEYAHQKPGARQLIGYAQALGIPVYISPGSELMAITHLYGFEDEPEIIKAMRVKKDLMYAKKAEREKDLKVVQSDIDKFYGAIEAFEFVKNNWGK